MRFLDTVSGLAEDFFFKNGNPTWKGTDGVEHTLATPAFGQNFNQEHDDTYRTATGSNVTAVSLTTDELAIGKYRIGQSIAWNMNTTSYNIIVELWVDGSVAESLEMETKDSGTDIRNYTTGFGYMDITAGGSTHLVEIKFRSENSSYTAKMYHQSLEFWRVE